MAVCWQYRADRTTLRYQDSKRGRYGTRYAEGQRFSSAGVPALSEVEGRERI